VGCSLFSTGHWSEGMCIESMCLQLHGRALVNNKDGVNLRRLVPAVRAFS